MNREQVLQKIINNVPPDIDPSVWAEFCNKFSGVFSERGVYFPLPPVWAERPHHASEEARILKGKHVRRVTERQACRCARGGHALRPFAFIVEFDDGTQKVIVRNIYDKRHADELPTHISNHPAFK